MLRSLALGLGSLDGDDGKGRGVDTAQHLSGNADVIGDVAPRDGERGPRHRRDVR